MRLVRCGVWQFRACEGSEGCGSTVDRSESFVGCDTTAPCAGACGRSCGRPEAEF